jgi:hypothetical protein
VRPLIFDREKEYAVFEDKYEKLISKEAFTSVERRYFFFDFKRSIIRLKMTGNKEFMERTEKQLEALEKLIKSLDTVSNVDIISGLA